MKLSSFSEEVRVKTDGNKLARSRSPELIPDSPNISNTECKKNRTLVYPTWNK